jgi:hypothetical protein
MYESLRNGLAPKIYETNDIPIYAKLACGALAGAIGQTGTSSLNISYFKRFPSGISLGCCPKTNADCGTHRRIKVRTKEFHSRNAFHYNSRGDSGFIQGTKYKLYESCATGVNQFYYLRSGKKRACKYV